MRRFDGLLFAGALSLLAPAAAAQQVGPAGPGPAPVHDGSRPMAAPPPSPPPATTASFPAAQTTPSAPIRDTGATPKAPAATPVEEPPYEPSEHGGLPYSAFLRATRGTARRSTGTMVTGIVMITLGAALMGAGTGVYVGANQCNMPNNPFGGPVPGGPNGPSAVPAGTCGAHAGHTSGMALLSSGVIGLGLGVPLTIFGAAEVPRAEAGSLTLPYPRATVAVGLRGAAFALHF